jgi:hypothetical protein
LQPTLKISALIRREHFNESKTSSGIFEQRSRQYAEHAEAGTENAGGYGCSSGST